MTSAVGYVRRLNAGGLLSAAARIGNLPGSSTSQPEAISERDVLIILLFRSLRDFFEDGTQVSHSIQ